MSLPASPQGRCRLARVPPTPELSHSAGSCVSPCCPHGAGRSLTGHLHLGLALQQGSHAVADDAAVEAGVGAVQRGDHVPAGEVSAVRGHPCHCHSPPERLQVLHAFPISGEPGAPFPRGAGGACTTRMCLCRLGGHRSVPQCHTGTHTGGVSTVHKAVTVTLSVSPIAPELGLGPAVLSPAPAPAVTL